MFFFLIPVLPEIYITLSDLKFLEIIFRGKKGGVVTDATTEEDVDAYKYLFQNWSEYSFFKLFLYFLQNNIFVSIFNFIFSRYYLYAKIQKLIFRM